MAVKLQWITIDIYFDKNFHLLFLFVSGFTSQNNVVITSRYQDALASLATDCRQVSNRLVAGTPEPEKGQGSKHLLRGTDKILNILKPLSANLEAFFSIFCIF